MKVLPLLFVTALDACFAVVTPILIPLVVLLVSWIFSDNLYGPFSYRLEGALAIWGAGFGVPVRVLSPLEFSVSIIPLSMTLVTMLISLRLARRCVLFGRRILLFVIASIAYVITAMVILSFVHWELVTLDPVKVIFFGLFLYISFALLASEILINRNHSRIVTPIIRLHAPKWLRELAGLSIRCAIMLLLLQLSLASMVFAGLQFLHTFDTVQIYNSMHAGIVGLISITLLQLAFLPNFLIWIISWQVGAGFYIGGLHFGGFSIDHGDYSLPLVPVFASLPAQNFPLMGNIILTTVCVIPVGIWLMKNRSISFSFGWKLVIGFSGVVLATLSLVFLSYLSGGSISPRQSVGIDLLLLFLLSFADIFCGVLVGVVIGIIFKPYTAYERIKTPRVWEYLGHLPSRASSLLPIFGRPNANKAPVNKVSVNKTTELNTGNTPETSGRSVFTAVYFWRTICRVCHVKRLWGKQSKVDPAIKGKSRNKPGLGVPRMKDLE
ncbi:DUF6350 family protein [Tropheryma whipplei]|uniref:cell division protein PerM n=1 Tax=Tropheryma whipplei TaxID=2039 RepID=UPI0004B1DF8F|nr:DUF6350 family protein [Tropheryma whipplei]